MRNAATNGTHRCGFGTPVHSMLVDAPLLWLNSANNAVEFQSRNKCLRDLFAHPCNQRAPLTVAVVSGEGALYLCHSIDSRKDVIPSVTAKSTSALNLQGASLKKTC